MVEASFDTWTSVFLFAAVQGLFLSLGLFFSRNGKRISNSLLGLLMLSFSIVLAYYVAFWTGYNQKYPQIEGWTNSIPFLFGPLIYLYFNSLSGKSLNKFSILHLLPFLLHFLYLTPFIFLPGSEKIQFVSSLNELPQWRIWVGRSIPWAQVVQMIIYAGLTINLASRAGKQEDFIKSLSSKVFLGRLSLFFLVFSLIHASYYVMVYLGRYQRTVDYFMALGMSLLIYYVGYSGFRAPFSIISFDSKKPKKRDSNLTPLATQTLLGKLKSYMESERPYLDGNLKLAQLADLVGMKPHDLSQLINDQFGYNFSDFINGYRIREAEKLLMGSSDPDIKVIEIAYDSGFNTKAAFYNAFKRKNGISPLSFRKAYLKSMKDQPAMQEIMG